MAKILIVDDEPSFCELLKTLLKSQGHEAMTAYTGRDALDSFMQCRPDFTLLDLRMPEMDGLEVLKKIRAIDPRAAVMILTAWGTDEMEQQARRLGATDFLSKAISLETILASLERGLKPPGPAAAAEKAALPGIPPTDDIFLVEGKTDVRDKFMGFLSQHGITAKPAKDGPTVLGMLDKERPPLIVLDMDLSGMKGVDVLRKMREKNYAGGIIMMTAGQQETLIKEAWSMGLVDILGKPLEPERLMLAIQVGLILTKS
ncbi:MAG: response regulator [Nitrospirae bacterium]|nr:MAG: response regulator [Nitrospirota bacterium]